MTVEAMPHGEVAKLFGITSVALRAMRGQGHPMRQLTEHRPCGGHGGGATFDATWAGGVAALRRLGVPLSTSLHIADANRVTVDPSGVVTITPGSAG